LPFVIFQPETLNH